MKNRKFSVKLLSILLAAVLLLPQDPSLLSAVYAAPAAGSEDTSGEAVVQEETGAKNSAAATDAEAAAEKATAAATDTEAAAESTTIAATDTEAAAESTAIAAEDTAAAVEGTTAAVRIAADLEIGAEGDDPFVVTVQEGTGYEAPEWEMNLPEIDPSLTPQMAEEMLQENKQENGPLRIFSSEEVEAGALPVSIEDDLPAAYPADSNLVTALQALPPTRNQGSYGSCWAHTATALAEFYKESRDSAPLAAASTVDYSERHLSYYTYHSGKNPYSDQDADTVTYYRVNGETKEEETNEAKTLDLGGNLDDAACTLNRWRGVAAEATAIYPSGTDFTNVDWDSLNDVELKDELHLTDAYYLNIKTETGRKHAQNWIREHGAVGVCFNTSGTGRSGDTSNYYKSTYNCFYNPESTAINHAVTAVGWDDNFPKENFSYQPEGNGAWLVRNSWATPDSGRDILSFNRYFWLSYYDKSLSPTSYAYVFRKTSEDDNKHDYYLNSQTSTRASYGKTKWSDGSETPVRSANVFRVPETSETLQKVREVSFITPTNNFSQTTAEIWVYKLKDGFSSPADGTLLDHQSSLQIPYPGRYSIPLTNETMLEPGCAFSVIVEFGIGISAGIERNYTVQYKDNSGVLVNQREERVGLNAKESYLGYYRAPDDPAFDQTRWQDLNSLSSHKENGNGNFEISAFTEDGKRSLSVNDYTFTGYTGVYDGTGHGASLSPKEGRPQITGTVYARIGEDGKPGDYLSELPKDAGTYQVKITTEETADYAAAEVTGTDWQISISKADIANATITPGPSLTYNEREQTQTVSSVVLGGITVPAADYTVTGNKGTNAGHYTLTVSAKTSAANFTGSATLDYNIEKTSHSNEQASGSARYGMSGTADLSALIAPGGRLQAPQVTDTAQVLNGTPVISDKSLSWRFADDASNVNKTATVTVPVTNATNYEDYSITVTLTVIDCLHQHTELRNVLEPTCAKAGYTGDTYCTDCGGLIERGETIPIDPENHKYNAVVTKEPTVFTEGITTHTCERCGKSYTTSIERIPDTTDYGDLVEDTTADGKQVMDAKTEKTADPEGNTTETTTVTVGGQTVETTVTEEAGGITTTDSKIWISGLMRSYTYTGSALKPEVHVYDGTRKLTEKTDYTVAYYGNKDAGNAVVTVTFKGNYKQTSPKTLSFTITPAELGTDVLVSGTGVAATGRVLTPVPLITMAATGKTLPAKDFTVTYSQTVQQAGTYTATVRPASGNFRGSATAQITVTDNKKLLLSNASVAINPKSYLYTGSEIIPKSNAVTVKLNGKTLRYGTDYVISEISNNVEPGTARVILSAVPGNSGGYAGSKAASFTISKGKVLTSGGSYSYLYSRSVPYVKGGLKPGVTVKDGDTLLKAGTDYTLSYANFSKPGQGVITVKGKGKYKSSVKLTCSVTQQDISRLQVTASDTESKNNTYKKPAVTIVDTNGKKLGGGDFTVVSYTRPDQNGVAKVTVNGKGAYKGTCTVSFRYYPGSASISKAKASSPVAVKEYTGKSVILTENDLKNALYLDKTLVQGTDFEVSCYFNNVSPGMAKVMIRGLKDYAGMKTLNFKILQRNGAYQGQLLDGAWVK